MEYDNTNTPSTKNVSIGIAPEHTEENCPFLTVQKILSGKWSLLVLCYLKNGALRFGDLQRYIPEVTQTTLTKTLRKLENDGIVVRTIFPVIPPHVEYSLSPIGKEIVPVLEALGEFGIKYLEHLSPNSTLCREIKTGSCRCCKVNRQ